MIYMMYQLYSMVLKIGNILNAHELRNDKQWYIHTMEYNLAMKRGK